MYWAFNRGSLVRSALLNFSVTAFAIAKIPTSLLAVHGLPVSLSPKVVKTCPQINIAFRFPIIAALHKSSSSSSLNSLKSPGSPRVTYWNNTGINMWYITNVRMFSPIVPLPAWRSQAKSFLFKALTAWISFLKYCFGVVKNMLAALVSGPFVW